MFRIVVAKWKSGYYYRDRNLKILGTSSYMCLYHGNWSVQTIHLPQLFFWQHFCYTLTLHVFCVKPPFEYVFSNVRCHWNHSRNRNRDVTLLWAWNYMEIVLFGTTMNCSLFWILHCLPSQKASNWLFFLLLLYYCIQKIKILGLGWLSACMKNLLAES